jgi:hypothetical protein
VEFSSHHPFYKLSCSWLLGGYCWSCLLWLACLFTVPCGIAPPSLFVVRAPCPLYVCFLLLLFIILFFSFFPGWGSVCPGGCGDLAQGCLWVYHVPLSSPCGLRLPKCYGSWRLAVQEPSWFLHLTWSGDAICELGEWRSQSLASSQ